MGTFGSVIGTTRRASERWKDFTAEGVELEEETPTVRLTVCRRLDERILSRGAADRSNERLQDRRKRAKDSCWGGERDKHRSCKSPLVDRRTITIDLGPNGSLDCLPPPSHRSTHSAAGVARVWRPRRISTLATPIGAPPRPNNNRPEPLRSFVHRSFPRNHSSRPSRQPHLRRYSEHHVRHDRQGHSE